MSAVAASAPPEVKMRRGMSLGDWNELWQAQRQFWTATRRLFTVRLGRPKIVRSISIRETHIVLWSCGGGRLAGLQQPAEVQVGLCSDGPSEWVSAVSQRDAMSE